MHTDKKILSYKKLARRLNKIRNNKKVVAVSGTWDIFHSGHLLFLDYAKRQGDILVAGVGVDKTIRLLKGKNRPIIPEKLRARLIAALEVVDFVLLLREEKMVNKIGVRNFLRIIKPDIWVVPYKDHNPKANLALAKKLNIKLVRNPRIKPNKVNFPISTSYIIKKIQTFL